MRALFIALALASCSSGDGGTAAFGKDPVTSVTSTACNALVEAYTAPDPIVRGNASIELVVHDVTSGAALDGWSIAIVPWMPAMGHGASTLPSVTPKGAGVYVASELVLIMPGTWQLRAQVSGACNDSLVIPIEVE